MLFKPELAKAIAEGNKTQTRRPLKNATLNEAGDTLYQNGRIKYQIGRDYAVQYAYGKPTRIWHPQQQILLPYEKYERYGTTVHTPRDGWIPFRIRITNIRIEDVRTISCVDALAEGFKRRIDFRITWCQFYDTTAVLPLQKVKRGYMLPNGKGAYQYLKSRPDKHYQAVALTFEPLT